MILVAKLLLVPTLIAFITVAGTRFGPRVAGVLTGLPVVAGPIALFMALEQVPFAARSAAATLAGEGSLAAFCVLYAATAPGASWVASTVVGWLGFLVVTAVLDRLQPSLAAATGIALAAPVLVTALTPALRVDRAVTAVVTPGEIALRMAAGVALMLVLTTVAHVLGPRLAGLLTVFPIATTVLAAFSHRAEGAPFAIDLLRGLALGLYSLTAFFVTLALTLERVGIAVGFGAAAAAALGAQALVLALVRRR